MRTNLILFPVFVLLLAACSGGGGSGGDSTRPAEPGTTIVTQYHPSGRPAATGAIVTLTGERTGSWVEFHDLDDSPKHWEGTYRDGVIDPAVHWRSWNIDGSIRVDQSDH